MRWLFAILLILLVVLQYRLWIAEGSLAERHRLERQIEQQTRVNEELQARNAALEREVAERVAGEFEREEPRLQLDQSDVRIDRAPATIQSIGLSCCIKTAPPPRPSGTLGNPPVFRQPL